MNSLRKRGNSALVKSAALLALSASAAQAEIWDGPAAGSAWTTGTNWDTDTVPNAIGAVAVFNQSTAARTITFASGVTVGSLTIDNPGTFTNSFASANSITFDAVGTGPAFINLTGNYTGTLGGGSNVNSIRVPMVLTDTIEVNVAQRATNYSGLALSFLDPANSMTGPGGITKKGLGTMSLADAANRSFTGAILVEQGRLRFNPTATVTGTSAVTVNSGGQLLFDQGTVGTGGGVGTLTPITLGTASTVITLKGLGTIIPPGTPASPPYTGNGVYIGAYEPGAIRTGSGLNQSLSNAVVLAETAAINVHNSYNFGTNVTNAQGFLTLTNVVSGPGKLIQGEMSGSPLSGGNMVLANTNTYIGGTLVKLGTLHLSAANSTLGSGDVFIDGASSQDNASASQFPTLAAGKLNIQTGVLNGIANSAALNLTGDTASFGNAIEDPTAFPNAEGGFTTLGAGINETVGGLVLGGVTQTAPGTYGSTSSGATFQNNAYFRGTGVITLALGRVLHWDLNSTTAGAGGATPAGTWNGTAVTFNTDSTGGAGGTLTANSLSTDPVVFTAGTDGTGTYTVNVTGTQSAASVGIDRGNVTLAGGTIATGTFNVASGATGTVSSLVAGGPGASVTKTGPGTLTFSSANPYAGGTTVNAGTLVAANGNALGSGAVTINTGGTVRAQATLPTALSVSSIVANGTGQLDLTRNHMVVKNSNLAAVTALITSGFNGGTWDGPGINSSDAAAAALASPPAETQTAIGFADNAEYGASDFKGVAVDGDDILVRYTYYGDATLDGMVDADDFTQFLGGYNNNGVNGPLTVTQTWLNGDFDYSGLVDADDFTQFLAGYNDQGGQLSVMSGLVSGASGLSSDQRDFMLAAVAAVPEPTGLGLLAVGALGMLGRRRRNGIKPLKY